MDASRPSQRHRYGIRLDGGTAYAGGVITDIMIFLVSLLTQTPEKQLLDGPCLREFRIRGVSTNIAFVENLLKHETFSATSTQQNLLMKRQIFQFQKTP